MISFRTLLLITIYVGLVNNTNAQDSEKIKLQWIELISAYRDKLLTNEPNQTIDVKTLVDKWNNTHTTDEDLNQFRQLIRGLTSGANINDEHVVRTIKTMMPNLQLANNLTVHDVKTVRENSELLELVISGLLKDSYPFAINNDSYLLKELLSYELQAESKIGEVGAGGGQFALLLHLLMPNIELFINEVDLGNLLTLKKQINNQPNFNQREKLNLVIGSARSTNFENYNLDKIYIRNAFHHFTNKKQMLTSIKRSLKKDGELYIFESTRELDKDNNICDDVMKKKRIIRIMKKNGYTLSN